MLLHLPGSLCYAASRWSEHIKDRSGGFGARQLQSLPPCCSSLVHLELELLLHFERTNRRLFGVTAGRGRFWKGNPLLNLCPPPLYAPESMPSALLLLRIFLVNYAPKYPMRW